ncbi:hypothetical protein F4604DRAFT_1687764 [Suillus subluteus]|nr:hypothetical protein F4604DRAFT_1687764 [Suillus subluteus]
MASTISDIDIFADEQTAALKRQLQDFRDELQELVHSAPAEGDDSRFLQEWCRRWRRVKTRLTNCLVFAKQRNLSVDLTAEERELGRKCDQKHEALQPTISAVKEVASQQAIKPARVQTGAKKVEQEQQAEQDAVAKGSTQEAMDQDQVQDEQEDEQATRKPETPEEDTQEKEVGVEDEEDGDEDEEDEEDEEEEVQEKRSIRVKRATQSTNCVESDPDVLKKAEPPRKKRMKRKSASATTRLNSVACDRCINIPRPCYGNDSGMACADCKRLKASCSLVPDKGKAKQPLSQESTATQASTTTPAAKPTSAAKPTPSAKPTSAAKPIAALKPTAAPGPVPARTTNANANAKPTLSPASRPAPGPSNRPVVLINDHKKRKRAESEQEEVKGKERHDEQDDAYMTGQYPFVISRRNHCQAFWISGPYIESKSHLSPDRTGPTLHRMPERRSNSNTTTQKHRKNTEAVVQRAHMAPNADQAAPKGDRFCDDHRMSNYRPVRRFPMGHVSVMSKKLISETVPIGSRVYHGQVPQQPICYDSGHYTHGPIWEPSSQLAAYASSRKYGLRWLPGQRHVLYPFGTDHTHGPQWEPSIQAGPYIHHGSDQGTVPNGSRPDRQVFNYPMEYEMCQYLARELNGDPVKLRQFEDMIMKDFAGDGFHREMRVTGPSITYDHGIWHGRCGALGVKDSDGYIKGVGAEVVGGCWKGCVIGGVVFEEEGRISPHNPMPVTAPHIAYSSEVWHGRWGNVGGIWWRETSHVMLCKVTVKAHPAPIGSRAVCNEYGTQLAAVRNSV